jgi:hypothetical protein
MILNILELALRWHVAFALFVYGIAKTVQFTPAAGIDAPVNSLSGQQLMWAFYGYSVSYAKFLGLVEMLGATLLLFRRTVLLGCLIVTTVLVNVIAQDIVYGVLEGALRAAILYQALTVCILALNREQVLRIWHAFTAPAERSTVAPWYWIGAGALVLFIITTLLERLITH